MLLISHDRYVLANRLIRLGLASPELIKGRIRALYRSTIGIARDKRRDDGWSAPPIRMQLHLTRCCNLNCKMCVQHYHRSERIPNELAYYNPSRELPLEVWMDLLDQVAPFAPEISLIGGEPTLYGKMIDLIVEAKKRHLAVILQTNGTQLHKMADKLVESGLDF